MKINKIDLLIVGSRESHCIESYYNKYLNEEGLSSTIFHSADYYNLTLLNRIRNKLGEISFYNNLNTSLIEYCKKHQPKIVWIFKGVEFSPKTLEQIKKLGIILVNYNPDHPFIRTFTSGGGKNIEESIPLYDLHFCYSIDLCDTIKNEFKIPTAWLPFGYELTETQFDAATLEPKVQKICFLGNPDKYRTATINTLSKAGFEINVFGHDWNKWLKPTKNISLFNAVYGDIFWKKLYCHKVQINVFRPHNYGSHNMRTFEIPAVGGIQLAPKSKEHEMFFTEEEDIFLYKNEEELIHKAKHLLNMNETDEMKIKLNARNKSVQKGYSYKSRAKNVYSTLNTLFK